MARKLRIEYPGAVYHVLDRGDRREAIFCDDEDRRRFLGTLEEVCGRTGWRIHAFVLMSNHYHLLVETPEANLVAGMKWLQGTYASRFNRRHGWCGHVFQGRYKAVVVEPEEPRYFGLLGDYLHLNPARAGVIKPKQKLADYAWSSYPHYLGAPRRRPGWLEVSWVLGGMNLRDRAADRRRYAEYLEGRAREDRNGQSPQTEDLKEVRRGWCLGGEEFRQRMVDLLEASLKKAHGRRPLDGSVRRAHSEQEAEKMTQRALEALNLEERDLKRLRKNDARKVAIGQWVRRHTVAANQWIAKRLWMGYATRVSRYCGSGAAVADPRLRRKLEKLEK